jgi:hypothetical protein
MRNLQHQHCNKGYAGYEASDAKGGVEQPAPERDRCRLQYRLRGQFRELNLTQRQDFPALSTDGEVLEQLLALTGREQLLRKRGKGVSIRVHPGAIAFSAILGAKPLAQQVGQLTHC